MHHFSYPEALPYWEPNSQALSINYAYPIGIVMILHPIFYRR